MEILILIAFIAVLAAMLFQVKKHGFKGAMFGGRILNSSEKIQLSVKARTRGHIKVHTLENQGRISIGLELVQKNALSYNMTALNLEREDALNLISALTLALEGADPE